MDGQKTPKGKMINNDPQNTTQKTTTLLKTRDEFKSSGRVSRSCSTSDTHYAAHPSYNPVIFEVMK